MAGNAQQIELFGRLLLLQSTVHIMPDIGTMGEFICRGLRGFPGIESVVLHAVDTLLEPNQECSESCLGCSLTRSDYEFSCDIPIKTIHNCYGIFHLKVTSPEFSFWKPHFKNLANVMAIIIENRNFNKKLEHLVRERTKQLEKEIIERRKAEESRRESEQIFKAIFDNATEGFLIADPESKQFHLGNAMASKMLGYSLDDIRQMGILDILPPEDLSHAVAQFEKQSRQTTLAPDIRVLRKDGSVFYADINSFPITIGGKIYLMVIFHDVTSRKQAEEALSKNYQALQETAQRLEQSMNMLQLIIESAPIRIFWKDSDLRFLGCNTLFARDAGFSHPQQLLGQDDFAMNWREQADLYRADDRQVIESCRPKMNIVEPQTTPTGAKLWLNTSKVPLQMPNGEVFGVLGVYEDITPRYQAEESLRESEEKFRLVFEKAPLGIMHYDQTGTLTDCNEKFAEIIGSSKEKVIDFNMMRQLRDDQMQEAVAASLRGEVGYFEGDYHSVIAGKITPLRAIYQPIFSSDGAVSGGVAIFEEISERRRAEEALREIGRVKSELLDKLNEAQHVAAIGSWEWNLQTNNIWGSDETYRIFGVTPQDYVPSFEANGKFIHPDDFARYDEAFGHALQTGEPLDLDCRMVTKDGLLKHINAKGKAIYDDSGRPIRFIGTVMDVTERKEAEEALQKSEAQYRLLAENVIDVIWTMDLNWKFIYASPSCENLSGYTDKEIVGMTLDQLLTPDSMDLCQKTLAEFLSPENLGRQEYLPFTLPQLELRFKDGSRSVFIEVKGSLLKDSQEQPMGIVGVSRDISERKQLEEQFLQAQKMEAVGTLAGGIAHDFNNILTAILGNIGLAVLDAKTNPQVQDRLAQAEAACLRAQALSQQLLAFAKGGAPVKKLFSVAELLTESTAFTCVGSPVKCETTFPENLWWIEADPGQIGQVFQNLTINALQAMPTGGTIKVWAENLTLGIDSGLPLSAGRYMKISVRDQGMGIPAEHLPRIFDPYFTTKQKGSGLGLASAYAIIKNHHGHIAVESKPGVGATFTIYLPAVEQQVTPQPQEDRELLVGKGKILVMDDEEMVREVLGRLLARLGYEAEFARDGGEAIEIFVQAQRSGQAFAAVILDLTVPGGMGGQETMARLQEIDPQVKAIVSSGYSDDPIMADFQKYGVNGVIAKPYRISELGKILHKVVMGKAENATSTKR